MKVAGIYLAAGQSRRSGGAKAALKLSPEVPPGSAALSELERCALEPLVVVVRADDNLAWLPPAEEGSVRRTETCLTAHLGLSFSLRCGLNAVLPMQPDAVIVALADQPLITSSLINRLLDTYRRNPELDYVACTSEGTGMPPALFSKGLFTALQELDGDPGVAAILHSPDYKGALLEPDSARLFMDEGPQYGLEKPAGGREWSIRSES